MPTDTGERPRVPLTTGDKMRRLGIALLVLACVGGVIVAIDRTREVDGNGDPLVESGDPCTVEVSGDIGDDVPICDPSDTPLDEIVEALFPARDAEALQQVQLGIDLGPRFTGTLVVGSPAVEVPESQLERRPALNQVFFSPGDDQVLEAWAPGRNCVQAIVWEATDPEGRDGDTRRTIDWCFEVT